MRFLKRGFEAVLGVATMTCGCVPSASATAIRPPYSEACAPTDALSERLVEYARELVTEADTEAATTRRQYELPKLDASVVRLATDTTKCRRAAFTFAAAARDSFHPGGDRSVHLIEIGNRYWVVDPRHPIAAGEYRFVLVLNEAFTELLWFTY